MKLQHLVRFVVAVTLSFFGIITAAPAAQAAPGDITLSKSSGGTVLFGGQAEWSLAASNPVSGVEQYNLSFTDTLPIGTTYVPGSTSPAMFGEPQVITLTDDHGTPVDLTDDTTDQVLIWSNVSDLTPGSTASLRFRTTTDLLIYTIGSTITNIGGAYASSDPREVPDFDASGAPIPSVTVSSAASSATTTVTAIKVTKSEPSPEGELLRGLGDHQTVYTVKVTSNSVDQTDDILVTDYLPAGLEFLGCGDLDFTGGPEYLGANNHATAVTGCIAPESVDTVTNPAGHPAGTYTKVVWDIGVIAASGTYTFRYGAAIPQRANTTSWTGAEPSAASGGQTANLNNNSGPSTRENVSEQGLTNYVDVSAAFRGAPVAATSSQTVSSEDLRMQKSVSPTTFSQGQQATYTLNIATAEYNDADNMVITDVMPDGLCPLGTSDPTYVPVTGCDPTQGAVPTNATITKVEPQVGGSYRLTFIPNAQALAHNGTLTITYKALMRTWYGTTDTDPTAASDGFTNTVAITGTTDMRSGVNPPIPSGTVTVNDASSASIASDSPTISKLRQANATPMKCSATAGDYTANPAGPQYNLGDRVCFLLSVNFPAGVNTKLPQLTDFLPTNFAFEGYQVITGAGLVSSVEQPTPASAGGVITWYLGSGDPRIVPKGALFQVILSATVVKSATAVSTNPKTLDKENLTKFRWVNTPGQASSLRDSSVVTMAPQPTVAVTKGIQSINGTDVDTGTVPGNVDGRTVRGGDQVVFRVDVKNQSQTGAVDGRDLSAADTWDVLPAGITCAAISLISDSGTCYDAATAGRPALTSGDTTSSIIRWQPPASWVIAPDSYGKLNYTMTVPAAVSVSIVYTNTAAVAAYSTATNIDDGTPVSVVSHPQANIDASVAVAVQQVPAASDTSFVVVPDAAVTKSVTSVVAASNSATQGVVGEIVTYTVGVKVPALTSVYNAKLTDSLPAGLTFVGPATALFSATGTSPATLALPVGISVDRFTGTLTFAPGGYTNTTSTDQLFEVTIPARIGTDLLNVHARVLTNTAIFTSTTDAAGLTRITDRTASTDLTVVAPSPTITKTSNPPSGVSAGTLVTYTLTSRNALGRPTMYDSWAVDCLPNSMTFGAYSATNPLGIPTLSPEAGTGTNGCNVGFTRLAWNLGSLTGGATAVLKYTVTITSNPVGQQSYKNTVTLSGSTLNDGKVDPTAADNLYERTFAIPYSRTITAAGATVVKSADQTQLTPGQNGTYTVQASIPASLNFYDAAVIDTLPTGMSLVSTDSITCTYPDASPCTILGGNLAASGQNIGWTVGDLAMDAQVRTVTVKYTAKMTTDPTNLPGVARVNTVKLSWMLADKTMPGNAGGTWDTSSPTSTTTTTVVKPNVKVAKSVNDTTVEPGQQFTYTLVASNDGAANYLSPAYLVTVKDVVPAGIVVEQSSLTAPGGGTVTITGVSANGTGGTITWTYPGPLPVNAALTLSYTAHLGGSATLSTATLTNTASVPTYASLPADGRTYIGPSATAQVTPQFPHLTPTKKVSSGPAYLGQPKTWTVTVTSDGNATARNVQVIDTLPANWAYTPGSATLTVAGAASQQVDPDSITVVGGKQVLTWANIGDIPNTGNNTATVVLVAVPQNPDAITSPGVGASIVHTNTVAVSTKDATGASGNLSGSYSAGPATASTRIDSADVKVTKTGASLVAGENTSWKLIVSNLGPDTAVGPFILTDTLPTGIDLGQVDATGSGWTCSVSLATVSCGRTDASDTLASGASFGAVTITGSIPASTPAGTEVKNVATVSAATFDPDVANNTDTVTGQSTIKADIAVTKASNGDMVPGQDYVWTVNVSNHGPSDQFNPIQLSDPMPDGLTLVSADGGSDWDCQVSDALLECTFSGTLPAGQATHQITVVTRVGSGVDGDVTNKVTIDPGSTDPNPDNNSDKATATASPNADLGILKAHIGDFVAGDNGTYRFTVTNYGPSDARNVKVTDTLPDGLTFISDDSGDWDCAANGQDVTCDLSGNLNEGHTSEVNLTVAIDATHTGDIVNTAKVSATTPDPNDGNNTSTDSTGIDVRSDLGITKHHTGDATAGQDLDFTLVVTNHGQSVNVGPITVTDTLPDGLSYVSAGGSGWNCDHSGQEVTCVRDATLGTGDSDTITLRVHVAPDAGPALLTNHASVSSLVPDPNPDNNATTDEVSVNDVTNILVSKSVDEAEPVAGTKVTYTLVVTNDGPSDADAVQIYDPLAPGLSLVSVDGNGWDCGNVDDGVVNCTGTTLAAGDTHTVTVVATVGAGVADATSITNTATVSTTTPGDDADDNTDDATVKVSTAADLKLAKSHDGDVVAGQPVTFTLVVINDGPSDAQSPIVVTDTLPAGLTFTGSTGPWTCVQDGQKVECTLEGSDPLLAGQEAPKLHIIAQVDTALDPADADLANTATVDSPTTDPDKSNNTATDPVNVKFSADLVIEKFHTGDPQIGRQLDFGLRVRNNGPSTASDVTVSDTLPAGMTFEYAEGDSWNCSANGQDVTCDLNGDLAAGTGAATILLIVRLDAAAYPSVDNTATVDSSTPDPDKGNNSSTDTVPVPPQVDLSITKTHEPGLMQVGQEATYTLTVANHGPTEEPGPVTVTDTLPDGLTYASSGGDGSCSANGQDVTCTIESMKVDETVVITVTVNVEPAAWPSVTNTATVVTPSEDIDLGNNTATDPAGVNPLYKLGLKKTLSGAGVGVADWKLFVTNSGPNPAPNGATVVDNLPGTLSYDGFTGDGWTCAAAGRTVTCDYVALIPVDGSVTLILHTRVAEGVTEVSNTAGIVDEWGEEVNSTGHGKIPTVEEQLAYTGGVALGLAAFGLLLAGLGVALTRARRPGTGKAKA